MYGFGFVNNAAGRHHFAFRVAQVMNRNRGQFEYWLNDPRHCEREDDAHGHRKGDQDGDYGLSHCRQTNHFEAVSIGSAAFSSDLQSRTSGASSPVSNTVRFSGAGKWNGRAGYTFDVVASDHGEPGRGRDRLSLVVKDQRGTVVASVSGLLDGGNIQSARPDR
jgi:hypothetical protein